MSLLISKQRQNSNRRQKKKDPKYYLHVHDEQTHLGQSKPHQSARQIQVDPTGEVCLEFQVCIYVSDSWPVVVPFQA